MTIEIRAARPEDADACAAAHIEGWRNGYRHLLPDEFLDAPEFATQRIDRWRSWTWADEFVDAQLYVGELRGRVVGFGLCGRERSQPVCDQISVGTSRSPGAPADASDRTTRGEVYAFYLHPDAWGTGVAPALISRCQEHLRDIGFREAVLWVLRDNPRARHFYENAGWSPTGREMMFEGPQATAKLTEPLPEIEYLTRFV